MEKFTVLLNPPNHNLYEILKRLCSRMRLEERMNRRDVLHLFGRFAVAGLFERAYAAKVCKKAVLGLNLCSSPRRLEDGALFYSSEVLPVWRGEASFTARGKTFRAPLDSYLIEVNAVPSPVTLERVEALPFIPSTFTPSYGPVYQLPRPPKYSGTPPNPEGRTAFIRMTFPQGVLDGPYPGVSAHILHLKSHEEPIRFLNVTFITPLLYDPHLPLSVLHLKREEKNTYILTLLSTKAAGWTLTTQNITPVIQPARIHTTTYTFLEDILLGNPPLTADEINQIKTPLSVWDAPFPFTRVVFMPEDDHITIHASERDYEEGNTHHAWTLNLENNHLDRLLREGVYLPMTETAPGDVLQGTSDPSAEPFILYPLGRLIDTYLSLPSCPPIKYAFQEGAYDWKARQLP